MKIFGYSDCKTGKENFPNTTKSNTKTQIWRTKISEKLESMNLTKYQFSLKVGNHIFGKKNGRVNGTKDKITLSDLALVFLVFRQWKAGLNWVIRHKYNEYQEEKNRIMLVDRETLNNDIKLMVLPDRENIEE